MTIQDIFTGEQLPPESATSHSLFDEICQPGLSFAEFERDTRVSTFAETNAARMAALSQQFVEEEVEIETIYSD